MSAAVATGAGRSYTKGPVLEWRNLVRRSALGVPAVDELPHVVVTSGRAAIFHALAALKLSAQTIVLAPTYHCPTMIAPILMTGLRPRYYPIDEHGLPLLNDVAPGDVGAIIVSHYFGVPRSLAAVREWSDGHGIALIEDCAHTFFGRAGERNVGAWGDFATASATKFFPVIEAGLLASASRALPVLDLAAQGALTELRGAFDLLELGALYARCASPGDLLAPLFALKRRLRGALRGAASDDEAESSRLDADSLLRECRMERVNRAPLRLSRLLLRRLARAPLVERRRENYRRYARAFASANGVRSLFPDIPDDTAPYVFPLWVDCADRVYGELRRRRMPVFRWDRRWPGTPDLPGDAGGHWSREVLQLLCHQNLDPEDVDAVAEATLQARRAEASAQPLAARHER